MTLEELRERQSWSLDQKIDHSLGVIEQFYTRLNGNVYISFSGGKDSTVLLWLARKIYPNIKAVFCNTGNEYPDVVRFVRNMKERGENVEIIYPKMTSKEVFKKFGFPLIGKEKHIKFGCAGIDLILRRLLIHLIVKADSRSCQHVIGICLKNHTKYLMLVVSL